MKIRIPGQDEIVRAGEMELEGVYCGVGIKTDYGYFGIAQRDWGLEITVDGELVASIQNGVNGSYVEVYGWEARQRSGEKQDNERAQDKARNGGG